MKKLKVLPPMKCDVGCGDCCGIVPVTTTDAGAGGAPSLSAQWDAHLANLSLPVVHAEAVRSVWAGLRRQVLALPVPSAGPSDDGEVFQLVWDREVHHLEIDIKGDETAEWFYMRRDTEETAFESFVIAEGLPSALLESAVKLAGQ